MMSGRERRASDTVIPGASAADEGSPRPDPAATAGGARTNSAAGINTISAAIPMISCEVRQSCDEISHAANGETVTGAIPMPAETSETARLLWVSNQPVTVAISGAKMAPAATPTNSP
jgi:hypothetical protein